MRYFWTIITIMIGWIDSPGQPADTLHAFQYLNQGHEFHRELKNYDSAFIYYKRAADGYQKANNIEKQAYCLLRCAFSAHRGNKFEVAETHYKRSLELYESIYPEDNLETAGPAMGLGSLYTVTGNYYLALNYTVRSLDLKRQFLGEDHIDTGVNYYNAGTAYMNYGEYENAMDAYQRALAIYLEHHGESHQRTSSVYVNMGILYDKQGEPEKALDYYQRSTEIDQELYGEEFYLLAYNYYNMAIAYMNLNSPEQAEVFYQKTVEQSAMNNLQELHAISHYGLGNIAAHKGETEQATALYQQAIDLAIEYFGPDFPGINHSYRAMAKVLSEQGAHLRAHEYLNRTLELLSRNFDSHHPFIAATYQQIATVYNEQGAYTEALDAIDKGYIALSKSGTPEDIDSPDDYLDKNTLLDLVREQGLVLQNKYHNQSQDIKDLQQALSILEKAIVYIDQVRRGFMLDDSKLFLQEEAMTTYEQAIGTALELFQETGAEQYINSIFQFMEKSKATLLSESLQGNSLSHIQGIPDSILVEEMEIRRMISFTESLISPGTENQDSLKNKLFELQRSYDGLAALIAREYPRYYQLKYQVQVKDIKEIQQSLPDEQAILTYFLGDEYWYTLALSNDGFTMSKIDSAKFKNLDLKGFRAMASDLQIAWNDRTVFEIYQELIEEPLKGITNNINRLIIIPDGALGHIPFDALLTSKATRPDGKKPYLVYDYAISYAPSVTLLMKAAENEPPGNEYHGFAPVHYSNELATLPGSLTEVSEASTLFSGNTYLEKQATETKLKELVDPGIVHLAMHALIDDKDPLQSKLVFAAESDTVEDGSLFAGEIYNLNLNSKITILSACNTGYGEIMRGEGIMNLSRAFQYAGSPNIVMSLWQASDAATSEIMYRFLEQIRDRRPKDISLQQSKISYLTKADPLKSHPAFWGTLVFMGDSSPVRLKNYAWKWMVLVSLFAGILFWFSRKSSNRTARSAVASSQSSKLLRNLEKPYNHKEWEQIGFKKSFSRYKFIPCIDYISSCL